MGRLLYSAIASLDGYVADADGEFGWSQPDEEVMAFLNERERPVGTYLYGRRIYELMTIWETDPEAVADTPESAAFAEIWQAADKLVYSSTLTSVTTRRTQLRSSFDAKEVRTLKASSRADLGIAGPTLARAAFAAGLVDEVQVYAVPTLVGGGLSAWPEGRHRLRLLEERRFAGGTVWLRYAVEPD